MKNTLTRSSFIHQWPESRRDQFSYEALGALYDWLTDLEEDCDIEFEYDPIAICCEWTEYDTAAEALEDYGLSSFTLDGQEWLQGSETTVIKLPGGGVLVQAY